MSGGIAMTIDTKTIISITDANQNFSKVARLVDENGSAVIMKNNVPRYLVIDFTKAEESSAASVEDVMSISERFLVRNSEAYAELAK
jgi:antitoxin Phd